MDQIEMRRVEVRYPAGPLSRFLLTLKRANVRGIVASLATGLLKLDANIITQDATPVNHSDTPAPVVIADRDIDRLALSKAVRAHIEGRVFVAGHRTIVCF